MERYKAKSNDPVNTPITVTHVLVYILYYSLSLNLVLWNWQWKPHDWIKEQCKCVCVCGFSRTCWATELLKSVLCHAFGWNNNIWKSQMMSEYDFMQSDFWWCYKSWLKNMRNMSMMQNSAPLQKHNLNWQCSKRQVNSLWVHVFFYAFFHMQN